MNELNLLSSAELGNGTYYIVAANSDGRSSAQSNEVEVNDIMQSIEVNSIEVIDDGHGGKTLQASITATDFPVGTKIRIGMNYGRGINYPSSSYTMLEQIFDDELDGERTYAEVALNISSYKVTVPWTLKSSVIPRTSGYDTSSPPLVIATDTDYGTSVPDDMLKSAIEDSGYQKINIFDNLMYDKVANTVSFSCPTETLRLYGLDEAVFNLVPDSTSVDSFPQFSKTESEGMSIFKTYLGDIYAANSFHVCIASGYPYEGTQYSIEQLSAGTSASDKKPINWIGYFCSKFNNISIQSAYGGAYFLSFDTVGITIDPTLEAPVLTYSASDRKLEWEDVEGATSYDVYKDGELVGTVKDGVFTAASPAAAAVARGAKLSPIKRPDGTILGYVDKATGKLID